MNSSNKKINISTTGDIYSINYSINLNDNKSLICKYLNSNPSNLIDKNSTKYVDNIVLSNGYTDINELLEYTSKVPFNVIYNLFNEGSSLPQNIFKNCNTLTNVSQIPDNYTKICDSAFSGCYNLSNINLHESITELEDSVFDGCKMLKSINVSHINKLGTRTFAGTGIKTIALNENIDTLPAFIFADCQNLKQFVFNGPLSIYEGAFAGCTSLTLVDIGEYIGSVSNKSDEIIEEHTDQPGGGDNPGGDEPGGDEPEPQDTRQYKLLDSDGEEIKWVQTYGTYSSGIISKQEAERLESAGIATILNLDNLNSDYIFVQLNKPVAITFYFADRVNVWKTTYNNFVGNFTVGNSNFGDIDEMYCDFEFISGYNDSDDNDYIFANVYLKPSAVYNATGEYIVYFIKNSNYPINYLDLRQNSTYTLTPFDNSYLILNTNEYSCYIDENYHTNTDNTGNNSGETYPLYMYEFKELGKYVDSIGDVITHINSVLAEAYNSIYIETNAFDTACTINYFYNPNDSSDENNYGISRSLLFGANNDQVNNEEVLPNFIFSGCKKLNVSENVSFIDNIKVIGVGSLMNCLALREFNNPIKIVNKYGFKDCVNLEYVNLSNCKFIDDYGFKNCKSLTSVDFTNMESLNAKSVFENCYNLLEVNSLNESIKKIGDNYFKNCKSLLDFDFSNIEEIGNQSFLGCESFGLSIDESDITPNNIYGKNIYINTTGTEENENNSIIIEHTSDNNGNIQIINVNNSQEEDNEVNEVKIELDLSNVNKIGDYAFANCKSITDIKFKDSNVELGIGSFMNCTSLKKVELPIGVNNFTPRLFNNCLSLKSVEFNSQITDDIELSGLSDCNNINSIIIPESNKYKVIDNKVIIDKTSNTIIYVVKDLTILEINSDYGDNINISDDAFNNSNISILNINEDVKSPIINEKTFANITNNNFHILISKNDPNYKRYLNILGNNKIYYI